MFVPQNSILRYFIICWYVLNLNLPIEQDMSLTAQLMSTFLQTSPVHGFLAFSCPQYIQIIVESWIESWKTGGKWIIYMKEENERQWWEGNGINYTGILFYFKFSWRIIQRIIGKVLELWRFYFILFDFHKEIIFPRKWSGVVFSSEFC